MRNSRFATALLFAAVVAAALAPLHSQSAMPTMTAVEPASGPVGAVLTVTGENLDQDKVAALYLTDGKADIKVEITGQTSTTIKFRVPSEAHAGRYALMVLTKDKEPRLIEQPVRVTIEPPTAE